MYEYKKKTRDDIKIKRGCKICRAGRRASSRVRAFESSRDPPPEKDVGTKGVRIIVLFDRILVSCVLCIFVTRSQHRDLRGDSQA